MYTSVSRSYIVIDYWDDKLYTVPDLTRKKCVDRLSAFVFYKNSKKQSSALRHKAKTGENQTEVE